MNTQHFTINVIASNGYKMKVAEAYSKGIAYIIMEKMTEVYNNVDSIVTVEYGKSLIYSKHVVMNDKIYAK